MTSPLNTFTEEAWFRTNSKRGGKIVSFGNQATGNSSNYDRHLYLDPSGHVYFGVYNNAMYTVSTPGTYNDNQWHYVVGSLSPSGMTLYVDGQQIGTNSQTTVGQQYDGYWRIGGDSPWSGDGYLNGEIDEVAIYPTALSPQQVQSHWTSAVDGNAPPVASFTASETGLKASFDATASSDSDGSVASYAWDFGDGSGPGSSATPSHTYSAAGTYDVKLTVTDDQGATDSVTKSVTVAAANQPPTAKFSFSASNLAVSFDGSASSDPDGSVASYAWDFGDGSGPGSSATPSHTYSAAGTYDVKLTVTDDQGATDSVTKSVTVAAANQPPTAKFSFSASNLAVSFDGSASSDPDGSVASYAWDFGDGSGPGSSATPSHTYSAAGTYDVKLTVTDDQGATDSVTKSVTVAAANQPPTAKFSFSASNLAVSFDGSASSDPDGSVASYAWDFGDGSGPGSSATPSHTYSAAGTYDVKLTVTDDQGATDSVTKSVTVAAAATIASDNFSRSRSQGWGTADSEGTGPVLAKLFSVDGSSAHLAMPRPAQGRWRRFALSRRVTYPLRWTSRSIRLRPATDLGPTSAFAAPAAAAIRSADATELLSR